MSENVTFGLENRTRKSSDFRQKKCLKSKQKYSVFGHFASLDCFRYKKKMYTYMYIKWSSLVIPTGTFEFQTVSKFEQNDSDNPNCLGMEPLCNCPKSKRSDFGC